MVYMCHIFPIQSIINGHLGWFQVFAIVNSFSMNIHVQNVQVCYIGKHVLCGWLHLSTHHLGIKLHALAIYPDAVHPLTLQIGPSVCCSLPGVHVFSLFNSHL